MFGVYNKRPGSLARIACTELSGTGSGATVGPILRDAVTAPHPRPSPLFPHTFCLRRLRLWAGTLTACSFFPSSHSTRRVHTNMTTSSPRRQPTQPSTRSSGSTSSSKPPSGASSSPLAWYLVSHVVVGMSRCRCVRICVRASLRPFILLPLSHLFIYLICSSIGSLPRFHHWRNPPSPFIVGHRDRAHARRLHTRAHARWPTISSERAWQVRQYPPHSDCGAACAGSVPQAAHPRADTPSLGCARTRCHRKVVSGAGMGPDALWSNRVPRVLS
jgi:hypothetical protein